MAPVGPRCAQGRAADGHAATGRGERHMLNLLTDVAGLVVGNATDLKLGSGVTVIVFDLGNGGNKDWARFSPYRTLGYQATEAVAREFLIGSVGAGTGATTATLKGGLGSAADEVGPFTVGAIVAVNALGSLTIGG